jgi:molybdenum cofactor cytidylyltransferase
MRAAIVLAAGRSKRFGTANKLLVKHRGKPLLQIAIRAALQAPVGRVIVVTGADRMRTRDAAHAVGDPRVTTVFASDHRRGHHASLLSGLQALRNNEREVLIFLGDMPRIAPTIGDRLAMAKATQFLGIRPAHRGHPGHPVLIRDAEAVRGRLKQRHPPFRDGEVLYIEMGRWAVSDIDRPGDLPAFGISR